MIGSIALRQLIQNLSARLQCASRDYGDVDKMVSKTILDQLQEDFGYDTRMDLRYLAACS